MILEDFENSIHLLFYKNKAKKIGISKYMLMGRRNNYGINLFKMIRNCSSDLEFRSEVISNLSDDINTDYLHLSLIMGLYFGCFNLYDYMYLNPSIRYKIINSNPNKKDTLNYFENNKEEIFNYFKDEYNIDKEYILYIINKMFEVCEEDDIHLSLYNNEIVKNIFMILMGRSLSSKDVSCRQAIDVFLKNTSKEVIKVK